jgi:hypothetical protein
VTDTASVHTVKQDQDAIGPDVTRALATSRVKSAEKLKPCAFKFLAALPPALRPLKTGEQYPRIVNQLALLCAVPTAFDSYLDALLIDERGDRQGFPQEVADELYRLRTSCESATCPTREVCEVANVARNRTS